jgi:hypothetical protein
MLGGNGAERTVDRPVPVLKTWMTPALRGTSPRGFPGVAKRATIDGMSWHHIPKDDAWKQAHLAMLGRLGKRAWLHCDQCRHSVMVEPTELAQRDRRDMLTPLLTISKSMRCTRCGARKGCCWPEPHNTRRV